MRASCTLIRNIEVGCRIAQGPSGQEDEHPAPMTRIKLDLPIGNSSGVFGQDAGQMIEMLENAAFNGQPIEEPRRAA